jgi:hypothetical protein
MHSEFAKHFELGRLYDIKISIMMFLDNYLFGIGTNQWPKEVFNYPLHKYYPVSLYYNKIVQPNIHNLHMKRLSEWGVFSILYYLPIAWILVQNAFQWNVLRTHRKRLVLVIIFIIGLQSIYKSAGHLVNHFSMIEFILFATLGLLLKRNNSIKLSKNKLLFLFIFMSLGIRMYSMRLPHDNIKIPQSIVIDSRNELKMNPKSESILLNTKLMKFWFPNWNEALAIEMEYYYKNEKFDLFKDRVDTLLNNKNNKPYLVYCWFYSIDLLYNQGRLSVEASDYWTSNKDNITQNLQNMLYDRQRDSRENILLRKKLNDFIQSHNIIFQ